MEPQTEKISVLLVEDHQVTLLGLKFMLENSGVVDVVGEAINGAVAVKMARDLEPDIVLMDVQMPVMDGITAAKSIVEETPSKVIMMTSSKNEDDIYASLAAGASGYCTKEVSEARLLAALSAVKSGDVWLDQAISKQVMRLIPAAQPEETGSPESLSERELEVLKLLTQGMSNQQISKTLYISHDTVKTHIRHILDKLAVSDRTQAAIKAIRENLV